jgi:hypothetical protein
MVRFYADPSCSTYTYPPLDGRQASLLFFYNSAMSDGGKDTRAWRRRLCGFERFHRVAVMKRNNVRYENELPGMRRLLCYVRQ